jgi:hypothetical protein
MTCCKQTWMRLLGSLPQREDASWQTVSRENPATPPRPPEAAAAGLEGLILVTDAVFYVTVMGLAALILLFESGAKPDVLHLVAVVRLVVLGAAAIVWNLGRHYRRICVGIGRQMGKVPRLARYRYRLDPGNPLWQAHAAPGEPRRGQEGGAVGPASCRFSRPYGPTLRGSES